MPKEEVSASRTAFISGYVRDVRTTVGQEHILVATIASNSGENVDVIGDAIAPISLLVAAYASHEHISVECLCDSSGLRVRNAIVGIQGATLDGRMPAEGSQTCAAFAAGEAAPTRLEVESVGVANRPIRRTSSRFSSLVWNDNPDIDFAIDKGGVAQLMSPSLVKKVDEVAQWVRVEWPEEKNLSATRLRVLRAWCERDKQAIDSVHSEGRGVDLTIVRGRRVDSEKLGRLACLAIDAGFGWVRFVVPRNERELPHVHASVSRD